MILRWGPTYFYMFRRDGVIHPVFKTFLSSGEG
jgi:hypothetical protein